MAPAASRNTSTAVLSRLDKLILPDLAPATQTKVWILHCENSWRSHYENSGCTCPSCYLLVYFSACSKSANCRRSHGTTNTYTKTLEQAAFCAIQTRRASAANPSSGLGASLETVPLYTQISSLGQQDASMAELRNEVKPHITPFCNQNSALCVLYTQQSRQVELHSGLACTLQSMPSYMPQPATDSWATLPSAGATGSLHRLLLCTSGASPSDTCIKACSKRTWTAG